MLRKRNSYPTVIESEVDINGAKRDKRNEDDDDDDDEEINVVDLSDSELDDQKPQTSAVKSSFSISNPEDLKHLSAAVKFRDNSCRPLDLSNKSKHNSPNGIKTKSWPANFGFIPPDNRQTPSPFVLNQVRPTVIQSADVRFDQELPDVDEHFRKSLGPQPNQNEADAKVDDHFARALGNMWWELKRQEANSPSGNISSELNSSSASTRSSSSR